MLEKIKLIQDISAIYSGADVHWLPGTEPEARAYLTQYVAPKLGADLGKHPAVAQICALSPDYIHEFAPFPGITVLIYTSPSPKGILFLGPVTTESYSTHTMLAYLQHQDLSQKTVNDFLQKTESLPRVSAHSLYHLMDILLQHLCRCVIPIPLKRMESAGIIDPAAVLNSTQQIQDISRIRLVETRYRISSMLTEAVKLGNLSLALQALQNKDTVYETIVRSKSPLRNMQNQCIILNTQLRHSLEGGSIHPYQLDELSNKIGLQIERLSSAETAIHFGIYIVEEYCRLVQEQSYQNLSDLTHQAVIYIKNNLHANLTVKDTARELSVNPDYLSHRFSEEMGMTFITFLNRERCKQAAGFLKHTNQQIKQISAIVGFNTISYFTKQFTHFYGKTPRDFRNERILRKQNLKEKSL